MNGEIAEMAEDLKERARIFQKHPFPSAECRKILEISGRRGEDFSPDLGTYFYDLWSPCNGIKRLLRKPVVEIEAVRQYFTVPLEERYSKYKPLFALVSADYTPDLFRRLEEAATMRGKLLEILTMAVPPAEVI